MIFMLRSLLLEWLLSYLALLYIFFITSAPIVEDNLAEIMETIVSTVVMR